MRTATMPDAPIGSWVALAVMSLILLVAAMIAVLVSTVPIAPNLHFLAAMAFPVVGALVVINHPEHMVGRLLVVTGLFLALGAAATTWVWLGIEGHLASNDFAKWSATWVYMPVVLLIPLLVAVFPTGRVSTRWMRPVLWVGAAWVLFLVLYFMVTPLPVNDFFFDDDVVNPWGIESLAFPASFDDLVDSPPAVLIVLAVVDLGVRWRRSRGVERLQMRWMALGLTVCASLLTAAVAADLAGWNSQQLWVAFFIGFGAMPAAVGVAVARYRLYDIDHLISRTVSYAIVAAALLGLYTGAVLLLGALLPTNSDLAVAGSTLAVAALFSPVRLGVQARVERRFNRARFDAGRVIEEFAAGLRDEVDLEVLRRDLVRAVAETMQPTRASLVIVDAAAGPA